MIAPKDFDASAASALPLFEVGEIVRHIQYGYRGVIVARDLQCQAPDAWYQANKTQPDRGQPWYHVLVDGSEDCTYAAQSNLAKDASSACIIHPWVNLYFHSFENGRYARNDTLWPHTWG